MHEVVIPFSPKNGNIGSMVGRELDILEKVQLRALLFYITSYGKPKTPYSYGIFRFTIADGEFHILKQHELYTSRPSTGGHEWVRNELSTPITLLAGKYMMLMKWLREPGGNGLNAQTIGLLESHRSNSESWMNWSGRGTEWHKDTGQFIGNFMIKPILV